MESPDRFYRKKLHNPEFNEILGAFHKLSKLLSWVRVFRHRRCIPKETERMQCGGGSECLDHFYSKTSRPIAGSPALRDLRRISPGSCAPGPE